jgi:mannose-6-phosphate isomerase
MINEVDKIYTRPWGTYQTLALTDNYQIKILTVNPNGYLSLQKHSKRAEHWVVVKGEPTITVEDMVKTYPVNSHIFIPIGAAHRIENVTALPAVIAEIQIGSYLGEDDIIRISDVYDRK